MFPLLSVIVALVIGLYYPYVVREPRPPDLLGTAAVLLLFAGAARILTERAVRRGREGEESARLSLLRVSLPVRAGAVAAYAVVVYQYHWPRVTAALGIEGWVLADEVVVLLPYGLLLLLSFLVSWSAEARLGVHGFRRLPYLAFQFRQYLLPLLPLFAFLLVGDSVRLGVRHGVRWIAELSFLFDAYPFVRWIVLAGFLLLLYGAVPFFLRWLWRATPLPAGPLRERLFAFSRREGFRARDLLVWPTGGNVVNAAVIGVAAPFRYVLLTDGLLEALEPEEVEAVFAHEVGHAKHHHMLLFFLFTVGYALLTFLVGYTAQDALERLLAARWYALPLYVIGAILLWFGILFGFVSRRFEQQADVFGALAMSRAGGQGSRGGEDHPFVRALERLASQLGDLREVKGWRHFPLGERIDFIRRFLASPEVRRSYRRRMASLLVFFFGLLAALGIAAAATVPAQLEQGRSRVAFARADWLYAQGRRREALTERIRAEALATGPGSKPVDWWDVALRAHDFSRRADAPPVPRFGALVQLALAYSALGNLPAARDTLHDVWRGFGDHPQVFLMLGDVYAREGRRGAARRAYEAALALLPPGHPWTPVLQGRLEALARSSGGGAKR